MTWLELMVVAAILATVVGVLLERIAYYQEAVEKAEMEYMVSVLKSALRLKMSTLLVEGRVSEFPKLAQENPMTWLAHWPRNYAGEYRNPQPGTVPPGDWYFDLSRHVLVYLVNRGDHFEPDSSGRKRVRFRLKVVYDGPEGGAESSPSQMQMTAVTLIPVEPYRWF